MAKSWRSMKTAGPPFDSPQNYGAAGVPLHFFIFDLLMLHGREVIGEPLVKRRELIENTFCRNWRTQFGIHLSLRQACRT
jgi:ATP-dependent DNA ligase